MFLQKRNLLFRVRRQDSEGYIKGSYDMIYLLTAIGLTPGGSSTVQIYTQNNTQNDTINNFVWKAFWDSSPEYSN